MPAVYHITLNARTTVCGLTAARVNLLPATHAGLPLARGTWCPDCLAELLPQPGALQPIIDAIRQPPDLPPDVLMEAEGE